MQWKINWRDAVFYTFSLVTLIQVIYYLFFFRRVAFFKQGTKKRRSRLSSFGNSETEENKAMKDFILTMDKIPES